MNEIGKLLEQINSKILKKKYSVSCSILRPTNWVKINKEDKTINFVSQNLP